MIVDFVCFAVNLKIEDIPDKLAPFSLLVASYT